MHVHTYSYVCGGIMYFCSCGFESNIYGRGADAAYEMATHLNNVEGAL